MNENGNEIMKPWKANLIVFGIEVLTIIIYFMIAGKAMKDIMSGNLSGALNDVVGAVWFLNLAALGLALTILFYKPLRTTLTKFVAIWNLIWVAGNIYMIYG